MAGTPTTDDIACPLVTHDMSAKAVTGMTNAADLDAVEAGGTVTPTSDTGYACTGSLVLDMAGSPTTDDIACPLVTHDMSGRAVTGMTNAADLDAVEAGATVTPTSDTGYACTGSLVLDMAGTPTTDTIACPLVTH